MSKLAQKRRALARWRYRARYRRLSLKRGDWAGFPADMFEVYGHHPDYPTLRGWIFTAWQYQPWKPNRPWWLTDHDLTAAKVRPGQYLLRRPGDAIYAILDPATFDHWQSWKAEKR